MRRPDRKFLDRRDDRIREEFGQGRSVAWLAATFGISSSRVRQVVANVPLVDAIVQSDQPPAEWELALGNQSLAVLVPAAFTSEVLSPDWLADLEDVEPGSLPWRFCVYFVQDAEFVKIGISGTDRVRERLSGLRNSNPRPLVMRRLVLGDADLERRLHQHFWALRVRGEWFRLDDSDDGRLLLAVSRAESPV